MNVMTSTRASKPFTRLATAALAVGALTLAACGDDDTDTGSADTTAESSDTTTGGADTTVAAGEILFEGMWARNSPAGATLGAAYLTITSPVDDSLIGAKADASIAATVEVHEMVMAEDAEGDMHEHSDTTMAGGMGSDTTMAMGGGMGSDTTMAGMGEMVMQQVDHIHLHAGEPVELKPGGYHIMLIDLVAPLEVGTTIQITLIFENAGEITLEFPVLEEAP